MCARAHVPTYTYTFKIDMEHLVLRRRTYWTEKSGIMIFITIPAMPDDGETRGEEKYENICKFVCTW